MAVSLSSIAPRFVLPKISSRVTAVRPARIATLSTLSDLNHECRRRDSRSHGRAQETFQSRISEPQCLFSRRPPLPLTTAREFSVTPSRARNHHFDTLKFVQKLKDEGFTEDQAVALMKVLNDVIEERLASHFPRAIHTYTNRITASKTSPEQWSFAKTRRKSHIPRK
jgi:hypothetical protein